MEVLIFADDLTGAAATAALLARHTGLRASVALPGARPAPSGVSVAVLATRALPHDEAFQAIRRTLEARRPSGLVGLRMDSTLRGPIPALIDGALAALPEKTAFVVPAFPASGRTTAGAIQRLDGVPVAQSPVGGDPTFPGTDSDIRHLIGERSAEAYVHIPVTTIREGVKAVASVVRQAVSDGRRLILADAETDDDVDVLGEAVASSGADPLPVDPGPFTAALASALLLHRVPPVPLVLGVSGSTLETAGRQVDHLSDGGLVRVVNYRGEAPEELFRLLAAPPCPVGLFIRTDGWEAPRGSLDALGTVLARTIVLLREAFPSLGGLYLSGGETAGRVLGALGASRLRLEEEVAPLTALATIEGGPLSGMWLLTKGGAVGGPDATRAALVHLLGTVTGSDRAEPRLESAR